MVFEGSGAGAVDDADVGEEDRGGVDFDVLEDVGGEAGGLGLECCEGRDERERQNGGTAMMHWVISSGASLRQICRDAAEEGPEVERVRMEDGSELRRIAVEAQVIEDKMKTGSL